MADAEQHTSDFSSLSWLNGKDWVIPASQDRSKKTLLKILVSAKTLFIDKGFEATTIAEISRHSDVSSGSIYNLFSDKNAICRALFENYRLNREAKIADLIARHDWRKEKAQDIVRFHLEIIFSSSRDDTGFLRLIEQQRLRDPLLFEIRAESEENFCLAMLELYKCRRDDFNHPDLKIAVRYAHYIIRGAAMWSILPAGAQNQFLKVTDKQFKEETTRMVCSYLGLTLK
ncbi:TetR/AcrR family transcriptional regulator [Zhongshania sp. BJYM1]|jgi:AcrR family transcriptional regulator|uniref:TetR/AcrR family transcriptional regulator n=1 Tax=Zhongshania aquatica TaxID=2965069 RepID=UPI0022B55424|nr:TetR/AcrR family transcriptional regulator [Marortus sp. BJYM1]